MIERDKFAFAALEALMRSEQDSEVIVDEAYLGGKDKLASFAETAYNLGDAMFKEAVSRNNTADEFRNHAL